MKSFREQITEKDNLKKALFDTQNELAILAREYIKIKNYDETILDKINDLYKVLGNIK